MSNHQEENNHAGAQSRAEGANLTDVLAANTGEEAWNDAIELRGEPRSGESSD